MGVFDGREGGKEEREGKKAQGRTEGTNKYGRQKEGMSRQGRRNWEFLVDGWKKDGRKQAEETATHLATCGFPLISSA